MELLINVRRICANTRDDVCVWLKIMRTKRAIYVAYRDRELAIREMNNAKDAIRYLDTVIPELERKLMYLKSRRFY